MALYIIPKSHSFLGVLFSLGLLCSLNPVRIGKITDSKPLARLSRTLGSEIALKFSPAFY